MVRISSGGNGDCDIVSRIPRIRLWQKLALEEFSIQQICQGLLSEDFRGFRVVVDVKIDRLQQDSKGFLMKVSLRRLWADRSRHPYEGRGASFEYSAPGRPPALSHSLADVSWDASFSVHLHEDYTCFLASKNSEQNL